MKRHGHVKGANKMVMFALLAVLLVSLGYLSMQGKEGFKEGAKPAPATMTKSCIGNTQYKNEIDCKKNKGTWA